MAESKAGRGDRVRKPTPERTGADRSGWASWHKPPPPRPAGPPSEAGAEVSQVVAEAVRAGYHVIEENLRQGRAAADRFAAGRYELADAPEELSALGGRLVSLARELSTVWFDLMGAALRDPGIRDALKPAGRGAAGAAAPAHGAMLTVGFAGEGASRARAKAVPMAALSAPGVPVTAGFHALGGHPPLTEVRFMAAGDGDGAVAVIEVPKRQPAGRYSGTVCDPATGEPLAMLTIEISA